MNQNPESDFDDNDIDPAQAETPDLQKLIQTAVRREVSSQSGRAEPRPDATTEEKYDAAIDLARNGQFGSRELGKSVMRAALRTALVAQLTREGRL